ncbi:MAG: glycosyltransferase family 4 protein [Pseudomonadota bacterium]
MQVIVNVQPLMSPLTGIGHFTRELTLQLITGDEHEPALTVHGVTGTFCEPLTPTHPLMQLSDGQPGAAMNPERRALWQMARRYLRNPLTRKAYRWLSSERLKRHTRRLAEQHDGLYWEPNYVLLPWEGRSVLTVHDLSHERYPEFHPRERVEFFNRHLAESLEGATRINAVSRFTANELSTLHGVDPGRIDIVSPGVSERFFVSPEPGQVAGVMQRHQLPPRFLLSVGTLEPRKNLARVMQAFAELPRLEQHAAPLLLVGQQGWGDVDLSPHVQRALAAGTIRRLGYVTSHDLPTLYGLAAGFVYVSHYEGFGMPVIEAMAAGVPVLTANVTAMAEVAGNDALTVDPLDTTQIRLGLQALLEDDHGERVLRARRRAAGFSWQASARALRASFRLAQEEA